MPTDTVPRTELRGREMRALSGNFEFRDALPDGSIPFRGHAAVFNSRSQVLEDWFYDTFQEIVAPGAFASVLQNDVRLLINHDPNLVLARTSAGTLRLSEDASGLLVEGEMAPTSYARDLVISMQRGDISQMSFAFEVAPGGDEWTVDPNGMLLRTVRSFAALYDVSPVTYPAYLATDAGLRAETIARSRAARKRLGLRAGARNSAADTEILQGCLDATAALLTEMAPLLESEQTEGEDNDDVPRCEAVISYAQRIQSGLQNLLADESSGDDDGDEESDGETDAEAEPMENDGERSALLMQALRHHAIAQRHGVAHDTRPGGQ